MDDLFCLKEVAEALRRLPKEVTDARIQRLKRASDLSMKHTYLSEEMQAKQTPFESYLQVLFNLSINLSVAEMCL